MMFKGMHAALLAVALIVASLGRAEAAPIAGRVEEELLSDGISLTRLNQRLELREHGSAIDVVLLDRATGAVIATRTVDTLPAEPAAAVAHLTMVVSSMLRERGLVSARGADWPTTFASATVIAYHRPATIAVLAIDKPGRVGDETRAAAAALSAAYRAAGIALRDAASLGAITEGEDAAIVARAKPLAAENVALVRGFLEGPTARAVVTIYDANGQLITGFSAVAGQVLQAPAASPAPPPAGPDNIADRIMRANAPSLDKDGQVRIWIKQKDPNLQLIGSDAAVLCRTPCGKIVDGANGEGFYFGRDRFPLTDRFHVTGHQGDVTADVKLMRPGMRLYGRMLLTTGIASMASSALFLANDKTRDFGIGFAVGGAVATIVGYVLSRAGGSHVILTPGRPQ